MCDFCSSNDNVLNIISDGNVCKKCRSCRFLNDYTCNLCKKVYVFSQDEFYYRREYNVHQKKCKKCGTIYCDDYYLISSDFYCGMCSKCCMSESKEGECEYCGVSLHHCRLHNPNLNVNCLQNACKSCCIKYHHYCVICKKRCDDYLGVFNCDTLCHDSCSSGNSPCNRCGKSVYGWILSQQRGYCKSCFSRYKKEYIF